MNERLRNYLDEKKRLQKEKLLKQEGLYDEVLISEEEYLNTPFKYRTQRTDETGNIMQFYKRVPMEISDEEYEELKRVCEPVKEKEKEKCGNETTGSNGIAKALNVIAWIIYITGFILGIACGTVKVTKGIYYTYTKTEFSFAIAITYWGISFISGTMFLGFGEIISLLDAIKRK